MNKNEQQWKRSTNNRLTSTNSRERKDLIQNSPYNDNSITTLQLSTINDYISLYYIL